MLISSITPSRRMSLVFKTFQLQSRRIAHTAMLSSPRPLHTSVRQHARKDTQDRESINVDSTEYSKSGGDGTTTDAMSETAFSKDKTRPEEQLNEAEKDASREGESNPLRVSPANHDAGRPGGAHQNRTEGSPSETDGPSDRARTSGKGGAPKAGKA